jgi:hypothetical protein
VRLYHFTQSRHLERIREEGLVPSSRSFGFEGNIDLPTPPDVPCVWLTQRKRSAFAYNDKDACIQISLPVRSKGLWHWGVWLERHDPYFLRLLQSDAACISNPLWVYYWIFFGVITPDRFRGIDVNPIEAISDERRQELLDQSARRNRLIHAFADPRGARRTKKGMVST